MFSKRLYTIYFNMYYYSILSGLARRASSQKCRVDVSPRSVPKFMKRMKVPDYKDKNVFGVPLIVHVQRSGQPLPLGLQQALRYLRSQCLDQVSHRTHALRLHATRIFTCDVTNGWVYLTCIRWCKVSVHND